VEGSLVVHKAVENDACGGDEDKREDKEREDEPGGTAKMVFGRLSDSEGFEERGGQGIEQLHGFMVLRFWRGWAA
jgi:hypothetical protein